jgi:PAS domain S-box-containing protein
MTAESDSTIPDVGVSRRRYERERTARMEAEALLESKSRALFEANQSLVAEAEALRDALDRLDKARTCEAAAQRENATLYAVLDAITGAPSAARAVTAMLTVLRTAFDADAMVLLRKNVSGHGHSVAASTDSLLEAMTWDDTTIFPTRPRRIADLSRHKATLPDDPAFDLFVAMVLVPFFLPDEPPMVIACLSRDKGHFVTADLRLLKKVATAAAPALQGVKLARRNALLAGLIDGVAPEDSESQSVLDAPLEAVSRAFQRLTLAQGSVVAVINDLLRSDVDQTDAAISVALARMGVLCGMDRVCVVVASPDGAATTVTQCWPESGHDGNRETVFPLPADIAATWWQVFGSGRDVVIPAVNGIDDDLPEKDFLASLGIGAFLAVPLIVEGRVYGFVGFMTLGRDYSFLPGEAHLIRSVSNVIATTLQRKATDEGIAIVNAALIEQRNRMQMTLAAMPDLLLEIDREGRFQDFHSGLIPVPDAIHHAFRFQILEEVLPPDLAAEGRRVMREIDSTGRARGFVFPFDLGSGPVWLELTASPMGTSGYLFVLRDVTQARDQRAQIERLSEVARRTTNLVVVTDAQRRIEWVNAAFEARSGYSLDEVRGQSPGKMMQGERTDPATVAKMRHALDKGEAVQVEVLNQSRTGQDYWLSIDIQPLRDADGMLRGFMAVETDVTDRRMQEEILRLTSAEAVAARQTLAAAVEALQDAFVLFDADERLVLCNARYRAIYPRSADAIRPGATFESILRHGLLNGEYAAEQGREEEWLAERLRIHRQDYSEIEQELADGRWLRIIEKATPDGGRVGLRVDITALKVAERRALDERAEAMEASRDGIAMTDAQGRFVYMNAAHRAMFGIETDEAIRGREWSCLYSPEKAAWMQQNAMPQLFQDGNWQGEVEGITNDGRLVDQEVSLTLKGDGGILCITRDIAQRRRETEERAQLREDLHLAQRREAIGQMAAGLAHDFNNLLATISGTASLIEASVKPGSMPQTLSTRIQTASDQAAILVKRLLTLGTHQAERRRIDLRQLLREAADLVRAGLLAPARLELDLPDEVTLIEADPTDVLQVVLNLAINARDAPGLADRIITISLQEATEKDLAGPFAQGGVDPARQYFSLGISDNGAGMSADVVSRIFTPYFSTKGAKGTGLGLAIVTTIVASNDGAVSLETQPGQGTRFTVLWPANTAPMTEIASSTPALSGRLDGRSILVVDDQEDVLAILAAFLEQAGAEVAPATDPRDVIEALREDPDAWDLVITDFDMPVMDGAALARAARAIIPTLPVVLVTALPGWQGRSSSGGSPFAAVLGKPISRDALVTAAETAIASVEKPRGR